MEAVFYGVQNYSRERTLYTLLSKATESKQRSFVIAINESHLEMMNKDLWSKVVWAPHLKDNHDKASDCPIVLSTNGSNNVNNADFLFMFQLPIENSHLMTNVNKYIMLFDMNDSNYRSSLNHAKLFFADLVQGGDITLISQNTNGNYEKSTL